MLLPYLHEAALTQTPVTYFIGDDEMTLYPLTFRSINWLNFYTRDLYFQSFVKQIELLPDQIRQDFIAELMTESEGFSYLSGKGQEFFMSNSRLLTLLIRHLSRFSEEWPEDRIEETLFSSGITARTKQIIMEMQLVVHRDLPQSPPLQIPDKQPRYEWTPDETIIWHYRSLMEKFHWTPEQMLDITPYQAACYHYLLPSEREQREDLERSFEDRNDGSGPKPLPPGQKHFNSPEEFNMWLAENGKKIGEA